MCTVIDGDATWVVFTMIGVAGAAGVGVAWRTFLDTLPTRRSIRTTCFFAAAFFTAAACSRTAR